MTAESEPIALLARALDQTGAIISRIRPDQSALPTPCASWDVRALVNHVVLDVQQFTVNDGSAQRSRVSGVTVVFDKPVASSGGR